MAAQHATPDSGMSGAAQNSAVMVAGSGAQPTQRRRQRSPLLCGCEVPWAHQCGRRNAPSPDPADGWTPSPYGAGGPYCQWRCLHVYAGMGNDPDALRRGACDCPSRIAAAEAVTA